MADPVPIPPITLEDLTEGKLGGTGAFDVLMKTAGLHCQQEFDKNRIKGQDYAQVYLTAMQYVLQNSVVFTLQKDEAANKANLVLAQVKLAEAQVDLTRVQIELAQKQLEQEELKKELIAAQTAQIKRETVKIDSDELQVKAQTALLTKQTSLLTNQDLLVAEQIRKVAAEVTNTTQELENLKAQECLLKGQYDLTMVQKLQTTAQTSLVQQKIATEKAQVVDTGVDENSVIGRQKLLYKAQTDGFARDAEQKAAKMLIDTWNVRRTTDESTVADATNMLNDATIGRAVLKVLTGVNA